MRQLKITNSITNRNSNSLYQYLQDISKEDLISPEEEVKLAQRIKNGDQEARNKLVTSNMRFVVSVAKQYQNQGLPLQDLINEGNIGLIKAAQRFDETRGFKFISFAVWWIRQSILQAIADKSRMVRLPLHQVGMLNKIKKIKAQLEQDLERTPSDEEVATALGIEVEKLHETVSAGNKVMSVDAPLGEDEDTSLIDIIRPQNSAKPDDNLITESLSADVKEIVNTLSPMERKVIFQYFGIGYANSRTLEEIAAAENITKERVRKIRDRALKNLRANESAQKLIKYL